MAPQLTPPPDSGGAHGEKEYVALLAFAAIQSHLRGISDRSKTARALSAIISEEVSNYADAQRASLFQPEKHDGDDASDFCGPIQRSLMAAHFAFVHVVLEIPTDHPWTDMLVTLVASRKHHPGRESSPLRKEACARLWVDLPKDLDRLIANWRERSSAKSNDETELRVWAKGWTRMNGFRAKLVDAGMITGDCGPRAIEALRDALEERCEEKSQEEKMLETRVPAAVSWILFAGSFIYQRVQTHTPGVNFWTGPAEFSRQRWTIWKSRLAWVALTADVEDKLKASARAAHNKMYEIEQKYEKSTTGTGAWGSETLLEAS